MKPQISSRDLTTLSSYLDGELSPAENLRLEERLRGNQVLRRALDEMQQTHLLLRNMPRVRAPRNFTLTPQMVGMKEQKPFFPVMGFVAALASFLFVLVLAGDLLGTFTSTTKNVAMQAMPILESVAPTQGTVDEERAQSKVSNSPTPAETQVEAAQALKAIPPAAAVIAAEPSGTLPPALLAAGQESSITATPTLGEMYSKEAPAPEVVRPGETSTPEGAVVTGNIEAESQLMATPTSEPNLPQATIAEELTPFALSQDAASETESIEALGLSNAAEDHKPQSALRALEVVLAITALITTALFFLQRHKTIQ